MDALATTTVQRRVKKRKANRRQLNIDIDLPVYDALVELSNQQGKHLRDVVQLYLEHGIAVDKGEMVEVEALPHIKAVLQIELARSLGQFRAQLQEDMIREVRVPVHETVRDQSNRLAALAVTAIREAGIGMRLTHYVLRYLLIDMLRKPAQLVDELCEQAEQKVGKKLAERRRE